MEHKPFTQEEQVNLARYDAAAHAVMTGSGYVIENDHKAGMPKHLLTGNSLRAAENYGLAKLLMDKGVFTRAEYMAYMADSVEREKARLEAELRELYGATVTLA